MQRLGHLDALRGLAALSVVLQHSAEMVGGAIPWFNGGRFGIALFFLISGFVIPFSFSGDRPINRFVVSRFFRLYPAFWASLIAASVLGSVSPAMFAANATMAPILFDQPDALGVYWTLFYELCFYALCICLFVGGMPTRFVGILSIFFAAWTVLPPRWNDVGFIGLMLTGTLLRKSMLENDTTALDWAKWAMAVFIVGLVVMISRDALDLAIPTLMALAVFLVAMKFELRSKTLEWLGKISYSLYLFQGIVLLIMPTMPTALFVCMSIALSILTAALSYHLIEAPFNRFGRRMSRTPVIAVI